MVSLLLLSFFVAFMAAVIVIRRARGHARRYAESNPQRFHAGDVPRLGGAAIFVGMIAGWLLAIYASQQLGVPLSWESAAVLTLAILPAMAGGIYEDLSQRVPVRYRLVLTAVSAAIACGALGLAVPQLGIPVVDTWFVAFPFLGVGLAFFAICGLPHAFNLIDGYNGLAGTVSLIVCLAIVHVALQLGDRQLAGILICLAGATLGFLAWNYPRGLVFAGDGGAYLWGVVIAIASITLVQRHPVVSPWFPMLLLVYPVWETLFSIYRKLARGSSPGTADALHFHQLIYRRIVRGVFDDDESKSMLIRNNRTSPYLWIFALLSAAPAVLFWRSTPLLVFFCVLFAATYVLAYLMIVRFKVPRWLRR